MTKRAAEGDFRVEGGLVSWRALEIENSPHLLDFVVDLPNGKVATCRRVSTAHQAPLFAQRMAREAMRGAA